MRKLLITAAAITAAAALPAPASAATAGPPETCDVIKNTICHLIPPRSVEDVCAIIDATTSLSCTINRTRSADGPPELPQIPKDECEWRKFLGISSPMPCDFPDDGGDQ